MSPKYYDLEEVNDRLDEKKNNCRRLWMKDQLRMIIQIFIDEKDGMDEETIGDDIAITNTEMDEESVGDHTIYNNNCFA